MNSYEQRDLFQWWYYDEEAHILVPPLAGGTNVTYNLTASTAAHQQGLFQITAASPDAVCDLLSGGSYGTGGYRFVPHAISWPEGIPRVHDDKLYGLGLPLIHAIGRATFGTNKHIGDSLDLQYAAPYSWLDGQALVTEEPPAVVNTRGQISFSEFETPFLATRGLVSFAELEVPIAPTRGRISFVELETPTVNTRGQISFVEFEAPDLAIATRGRISFAEMESPFVITRGRIAWVEIEVPDVGASSTRPTQRLGIFIGLE